MPLLARADKNLRGNLIQTSVSLVVEGLIDEVAISEGKRDGLLNNGVFPASVEVVRSLSAENYTSSERTKSAMRRIGLIGVGFVGRLFVDELLEADYPLTVYDIDESKIEYATDRGAKAGENPADVVEQSNVVIFALPGHEEVISVMEEDDVLDTLDNGQIVVDTTTTGPKIAARYENRCAEHDIGFLSAPLTRSAPTEGVHMMVGGDKHEYEEMTDVLDCLSAAHRRIGDAADAQTFKLMLQLRYAGHRAIDAEIVEFGRDNGVDPHLLNEFLGMDIWEEYFDDEFEQDIEGMGGRRIWHKDIGYAVDLARQTDTAIPLSSDVHEAYKATARSVGPDQGHAAAIIEYWQRLNGGD